jgi:hypothetical protein
LPSVRPKPRVAERQAETALERLRHEGRLALGIATGLLFEAVGLLEFLPVLSIDRHGLTSLLGGLEANPPE